MSGLQTHASSWGQGVLTEAMGNTTDCGRKGHSYLLYRDFHILLLLVDLSLCCLVNTRMQYYGVIMDSWLCLTLLVFSQWLHNVVFSEVPLWDRERELCPLSLEELPNHC